MSVVVGTIVNAADKPGTTHIAKWKADKACAMILMFDDSSSTHVNNVYPALQKYGFTGTFYINPGKGHYSANQQFWDKTLPEAGFELGNHTLTHSGGATATEVIEEITASNEIIRQNTPNDAWPRLVSFAKPGGLKPGRWPLSPEEYEAVLAENNLILRPNFGGRGAQISLKTGEQMLAHVDKAVADQSMECIIFHGVGGDWISVPLNEFIVLLEGLSERQDQVWVTHHMDAYKYAQERDSAEVKILNSSANHLSLQLTTDADPALFDQKLTLKTVLPETWKKCLVTQGDEQTEIQVKQGLILYEALPGDTPITITKK